MTDDGHRERLDFARQLGADLVERSIRLRGDQYALSLREQMRDQCRGGVGFASARRALNQSLGVGVDISNDLMLPLVHRHGVEFVTPTDTMPPGVASGLT